jgi:phospholipid N-methyltransferase
MRTSTILSVLFLAASSVGPRLHLPRPRRRDLPRRHPQPARDPQQGDQGLLRRRPSRPTPSSTAPSWSSSRSRRRPARSSTPPSTARTKAPEALSKCIVEAVDGLTLDPVDQREGRPPSAGPSRPTRPSPRRLGSAGLRWPPLASVGLRWPPLHPRRPRLKCPSSSRGRACEHAGARPCTGDIRRDPVTIPPPVPAPLDRLQAVWHFFLNAFRSWDQTASFVPSSRYLVDAMVAGAALPRARAVVELGTGTGGVTEALLASLPSDAKLYAVEIDGPLLEATARRLPDPRLVPLHGSAADLTDLLPPPATPAPSTPSSRASACPCCRPTSASRSSPARSPSSSPAACSSSSATSTRSRRLQPDPRVVALQPPALPARPLRQIHKQRVIANFPPADVFVCRQAVQ